MLKLYKVTSALVCGYGADQGVSWGNSQRSREQVCTILETEVFDEVNNVLAETYKNIKSAVWSTYQGLLKNEKAQTIGISDDEFLALSSEERDALL